MENFTMENFEAMNELEEAVREKQENVLSDLTNQWFRKLIQEQQYVGDVYSISYETALVLIHDHHRREVGGIPSLSFLIATVSNRMKRKLIIRLKIAPSFCYELWMPPHFQAAMKQSEYGLKAHNE